MQNILATLFIIIALAGWGQKNANELTGADKDLYDEHVRYGQPDPDQAVIYIRQGYILQYNDTYRIPNWVAYRIIPDYLNTPKREKKYTYFRTDHDISNPVKDADYTGIGYARGHMAPYFAMGGDRDGDDIYSNLFDDSADPEDDTTVFQANYMSNIAPQDQDALNGAGGPWYALETVIRNKLVGTHKMKLNLVLGTVIDDPDNLNTMKNKKGDTRIVIPEQFYQVIITETASGQYITAGFLFPHVRERSELPSKELMYYLVPVDSIETITGYDFFNQLSAADQKTESQSNADFWSALLK